MRRTRSARARSRATDGFSATTTIVMGVAGHATGRRGGIAQRIVGRSKRQTARVVIPMGGMKRTAAGARVSSRPEGIAGQPIFEKGPSDASSPPVSSASLRLATLVLAGKGAPEPPDGSAPELDETGRAAKSTTGGARRRDADAPRSARRRSSPSSASRRSSPGRHTADCAVGEVRMFAGPMPTSFLAGRRQASRLDLAKCGAVRRAGDHLRRRRPDDLPGHSEPEGRDAQRSCLRNGVRVRDVHREPLSRAAQRVVVPGDQLQPQFSALETEPPPVAPSCTAFLRDRPRRRRGPRPFSVRRASAPRS